MGSFGQALGVAAGVDAMGGGPEDPVGDVAALGAGAADLFEGGDALGGALTDAGKAAVAKESTPIYDSIKSGSDELPSSSASKLGTFDKLNIAGKIFNALPKLPNPWSTVEGAASSARSLSSTQFRGM